uniref:Cupin superfamily (DUF985) n=1 Tax=Candidatus Kentrum eta TaxID=2126337 RepID=A0A450VNH8_9GAMM|nr:MAG: Cupin superfamily (DUF985) [Candidatus Kentron sp. H]VFK06376.1 MAG: Cupin superfamily (DUF985) [Candidatus Kentron sp. H]VFK09639.1 MAG: Cupin superfamily (DUF985) [Candidatus Kentron sp. H]
MKDKNTIIQSLKLERHREGGYFSETYRSTQQVETERSGQNRSLARLRLRFVGWAKERSDVPIMDVPITGLIIDGHGAEGAFAHPTRDALSGRSGPCPRLGLPMVSGLSMR